jgi:hypothetical protein
MPGISGNVKADMETFLGDSMHDGMNDADKQYGRDWRLALRQRGFDDTNKAVETASSDGEVTAQEEETIRAAFSKDEKELREASGYDVVDYGQKRTGVSGNYQADLKTFLDDSRKDGMSNEDALYGLDLAKELREQGRHATADAVLSAVANRSVGPEDVYILAALEDDANTVAQVVPDKNQQPPVIPPPEER